MNAAKCAIGSHPRCKDAAGESSSDGLTQMRGRIDTGMEFAEVSRLDVR